jgi:hypothetical protein
MYLLLLPLARLLLARTLCNVRALLLLLLLLLLRGTPAEYARTVVAAASEARWLCPNCSSVDKHCRIC